MKPAFAVMATTFMIAASIADQGYDSFRQECPTVKPYPSIFVTSDDFNLVKSKVADRLAGIGLAVEWDETLTPEDLPRMERLASIVVPSLEKYPPSWFKTVDLRTVRLTKDLWVDGQLRKAMPDPMNHRLYYADNNDLVCLAGMEERVHHEFYHLIEASYHDGNMLYKDPQWMTMNPSTFEYGPGGAAAYDQGPDWQNLGHPDVALVSRYAAFALEEDKAEVFGWMMTEGFAQRLKDWTTADALLAEKYYYLVDFFNQSSQGTMNAAYFDQFAK